MSQGKTVSIGYDSAHEIVDANKSLFWDGWTIIEWTKGAGAQFAKNGMYRNGMWGFANRYEPSAEGWKVPVKYVARRSTVR